LLLLLIASYVIRVALVAGGGQAFFPDESRIGRSGWFLLRLLQGHPGSALDAIYGYSAFVHPFFTLLACIPLAVQFAAVKLAGLPLQIEPEMLWISALFLASASVVSIGLTYAIARRSGGDEREAMTAALLMASSGAMVLYSRHILPYDCSMALAMLSLWIGLDDRPGFRRSFLAGVVASLAFLTYFGYWLLAATVLVIHCLRGLPSLTDTVRRGLAAGLGLASPILLALAIGYARHADPIGVAKGFTGTITQGDFAEGWYLPWAYLWHLEHGLLIAWALGGVALLWPSRDAVPFVRMRGLVWLGAAALIYSGLVVFSVGLGKFVVYGRLARQLVPFFCLGTGSAVTRLIGGRWIPRPAIWLGAGALSAQLLIDLWPALCMDFPRDVDRHVEAEYGPVFRTFSFVGPRMRDLDALYERRSNSEVNRRSRYVLVNPQYIYPLKAIKPLPEGKVLFHIPHPLQWFPLQYEGFTSRERSLLRTGDASQILIETGKMWGESASDDVPNSVESWDGDPG
jgi:hypothetical protein